MDDLELKNFKVWEDNKEQQLKTFSFGADPNGPAGQKRYIVLFFDNSTMAMGEQAQARQAAAHFIESNAGPDRLIAVVNFTGALQVAQNFTDDIDRLKQVVGGIKVSVGRPRTAKRASLGAVPRLGGGIGRFRRAQHAAGRCASMAKNLADVPGRKSLILFTSGFPLTNEGALGGERGHRCVQQGQRGRSIRSTCAASAAACRADGRPARRPGAADGRRWISRSHFPASRCAPAASRWRLRPCCASPLSFVRRWEPQAGRRRRRGGGSTGGNTGGARAAAPARRTAEHRAATRAAIPADRDRRPPRRHHQPATPAAPTPTTAPARTITTTTTTAAATTPTTPTIRTIATIRTTIRAPEHARVSAGATDNQQVMYLLAEGTGGFVIVNTNDMIGGMKKIGKEQNQYYIVGYTPPESAEGSCHTLKVKVDRGGTTVRSRAGYCNVKSHDVLAGNPVEKTLESRATSTAAGTIAAAMRAPFFYTGANTARVAVAIEIPSETIKFEKVKGKMHSTVNVLGIAYKQDGTRGGALQRRGQTGFRKPEGSAGLQGNADALRKPVRRGRRAPTT